MSRVKHVSFEELAGNLDELLSKVRSDHTSIVVEYGSGVNVLIKPYAPARQGMRKERKIVVTPVADSGRGRNPSKQPLDGENISSVGAVYDLDPDSITTG
jgi:hypothetical protein